MVVAPWLALRQWLLARGPTGRPRIEDYPLKTPTKYARADWKPWGRLVTIADVQPLAGVVVFDSLDPFGRWLCSMGGL